VIILLKDKPITITIPLKVKSIIIYIIIKAIIYFTLQCFLYFAHINGPYSDTISLHKTLTLSMS